MYESIDQKGKPKITLLLKGPPGAGKTFKAAQFPKPVIFNFDNNLSGLRKLPADLQKSIRVVQPRMNDGKPVKAELVWDNFVKQLEKVCTDDSVETIVIDSLSTMAEVLFDKILGTGNPNKRIEIQHWGDFSRYVKWLGESLLCTPDLDKHVVFLAHERIEIDPQSKEVKYTLNIGGSMRESIDLFFSDSWRVWVKAAGDKVVYWVRTLPTPYCNAKASLSVPADFIWDNEKEKIFAQL